MPHRAGRHVHCLLFVHQLARHRPGALDPRFAIVQVLFSIRPEQQHIEQLRCNLLFRRSLAGRCRLERYDVTKNR